MQAWGLTDLGCVRKQNQDAYRIKRYSQESYLCIVCDGMGGAKAGNIASALALDIFVDEVDRHHRPGMTAQEMETCLRQAAALANSTVYEQSQQIADFAGMGTTLVAAYLNGTQTVVANVGDSRCYLLNRNGAQCVTTDHSLVQLMVQRGQLTMEQAKSYPGKNFITRAVGTESGVQCDLFQLSLQKGDNLLLCSDGLSNMLDDQEILFEVVHGVNKELCCQRLLDIAKERGAPDNVTSILVVV